MSVIVIIKIFYRIKLFVENMFTSLRKGALYFRNESRGLALKTSLRTMSTPSPRVSANRDNAHAPLRVDDAESCNYLFNKKHDEPSVYSSDMKEKIVRQSPMSLIQSNVDDGVQGSFLVTNLASIRTQHELWTKELPMVKPFYAVKCNPDPTILRLLASLGCGFDCASQGEIDLVMNKLGPEHNISPSEAGMSIIYAHPAKMNHMLQYAINNNIGMTVFDGEDELYKIASMNGYKNMKVLLRLATDDKSSICQFSNKFGCHIDEVKHLLTVAKALDINVAGCSFHVGSGCGDPQAYTTALRHCREVFQIAELLDIPSLSIIDIGGGFPGGAGGYGGPSMPTFQELAATIRHGIDSFCDGTWTSRSCGKLQFIAEPGRYFVSSSTTIASKVCSRKGGNSEQYQALYLDDGVYGSFNNVVYDHFNPIPRKLSGRGTADTNKDHMLQTAVFGPTCDGLDELCKTNSTLLPRCEINDWLLFENFGAYTHTASFNFNGFTHVPTKLYCDFEQD